MRFSELRSRLAVASGFILKNTTTDRFLLLSAQEALPLGPDGRRHHRCRRSRAYS